MSEEESSVPADVPEPPWRRDKPRPVRSPLSREAIVDAGLRVLDRDGADALSMRRVATELGTGAASLYWHVANKAQLIELLIDRVAGEIELPAPDPARWQEQIKEMARQIRDVMSSHRDIARLTLGRIPMSPNTVRWTEWVLGLMRGAGVPGPMAAYAGDLLGLYVGAYVYEESIGLQSPTGEDLPPEKIMDMFRGYFTSLPADQFPNITSLVDDLLAGSHDERFDMGLEVIVRGFSSFAEKPSSRSSASKRETEDRPTRR
jgi:AcrR family transcriptional regulator